MKMLSHNWLLTDQPTNQQSDQLLELLEWLFATKNKVGNPLVALELFKIYYPVHGYWVSDWLTKRRISRVAIRNEKFWEQQKSVIDVA